MKPTIEALEFAETIRYLALAKGSLETGLELAQKSRTFPRVQSILKAAISGGTSSNWAGDAYDAAVTGGAFIDVFTPQSIFDTIALYSHKASFRVAVAYSPTPATASQVNEGEPIPAISLTLDKRQLPPIKVAGIIAANHELLNATYGNRWLLKELGKAVVKSQNAVVLAGLTPAGSPGLVSAGTGAANAAADVATLLRAVNTEGASPILVLSPSNAATASTFDHRAFANLTPTGGSIAGVPAIVAEAAGDDLYAIDAARLLTASDDPVPYISHAGVVQLVSNPASGGVSSIVSLFQEDAVAIRVSRRIGFDEMRAGSTAVITGAAW